MNLVFLFVILLLSHIALADPLEITIEYENCTEVWSCSEWSSCSGGTQTRTCTDLNNCNTTLYKPEISQSCTSGTPTGSDGPSGSGGSSTLGTSGSGGTKSGNKTITQPNTYAPPEPELKESDFLEMEMTSPEKAEAGEPISVVISMKSTKAVETTVEILREKQDVNLQVNEPKTLYFIVYTPEIEGNYNLVAVTPYATANKTILLTYKPLFLYVTPTGNQEYEIHIKNFDSTSTTELQIVKDGMQTVYLDLLKGKLDYKVNITFSNSGEYNVKAKSVSGFSVLDEDTRIFDVKGNQAINYGLLILIFVLIIILIGSILIFKELRR
ncbi:hypothetical protein A3K64_03450 [Candidatus Micrarchaeota archaeon RBG_16_36_9]|nr:MAG: hypothetical protein A3K64_03450 [Candidatus Micrarchaeota archaeon RBG_16_36_9]